jgi:hypothetical protein
VWLRKYPEPIKSIYWSVIEPVGVGVTETAPFQPRYDEDFLTFFQWPTEVNTGVPLQWTRLPVIDKLWNDDTADKGGFIQEVTGWKPSPFQTQVDTLLLARAAGLWHPAMDG